MRQVRRSAVGQLALWLALLVSAVGCAPDAEGTTDRPPGGEARCAAAGGRMSGVVLAGSGSNLPLVRALVERYAAERPGVEMSVPESIGTKGAIRAVRDGAIDVGLASRVVSASELGEDLEAVPFATSIVVVGVEASSPVREATLVELEGIFSGERARWSSGERVAPVLREPGDSSHRVVALRWPTLGAAMERGRARGHLLVTLTDQEMGEALSTIPGAVGVIDLGLLELERRRVRALVVEGVEPSVESAESGRYPLTKPLFFLMKKEDAPEEARDFVRWVGEVGQEALIRQSGYLVEGGR